jgi:preprotein translocase SecE subunit
MAPIAARRTEEEEEMLESEAEAEEVEAVQSAAPAVSDSRRRRQMKRGEVPEPEPEAPVPAHKDRPTPSQREEPTRSRNFIVRFVQSLNNYRKETDVELRKVAWPSREETSRLTYIVVAVTVVSSLFLGTVSFLFSLLITQAADATNGTLAGLVSVALILVVTVLWLLRDRIWRPKSE